MSAPLSHSEAGAGEPPGASRITSWHGFQLSSFQIRAIDAIRARSNVLVSAPTGAGKTLVAEYAIADAVARARRCVWRPSG